MARADVVTLTFDELPQSQEIDMLNVQGVSISFLVDGMPSTNALYGVAFPASATYLLGRVLISGEPGLLGLAFATPTSTLGFGAAYETTGPNTFLVSLFDSDGDPIQTDAVATDSLPACDPAVGCNPSEAYYSYVEMARPIRWAVLDFSTSVPYGNPAAFAIDNLTFTTTPELGTIWFVLPGLLVVMLGRRSVRSPNKTLRDLEEKSHPTLNGCAAVPKRFTVRLRRLLPVLAFVGAVVPSVAAPTVTLSGPAGDSQPVGVSNTWIAAANGIDSSVLQFRWLVTRNGVSSIVIDYSSLDTFRWMPLDEGSYTATVIARNTLTQETGTTSAAYTASSRLGPDGSPTTNSTNHPLVALYSSTCNSGKLRVHFYPLGGTLASSAATAFKPCVAGASTNLLVGGMRANTVYLMQQEISNGWQFTFGPPVSFTTSSVQAGQIPPVSVSGTSTAQETMFTNAYLNKAVSYDLSGNVLWYSPSMLLFRLLGGGTMLGLNAYGNPAISELDLAGNILHQTNPTRVSEQLVAMGNPPIVDFHHDAIRLPNGYT